MKLWYQKYRDGLISAVAAIGILGGFGVGGYVECSSNNNHTVRTSMVNRTLGVIVDSSLSEVSRDNVRNAVRDVVAAYRTNFKINYNVKFTFVDIQGREVTESKLNSSIPETFRGYNHNIIFTDAATPQYASENGTRAIGYCQPKLNMLIVPQTDHRCVDTLYNIVAHELTHMNGFKGHLDDERCLMSAKANTIFPVERKPFCATTRRVIMRNK